MIRLNARQLRDLEESDKPPMINRHPLYLILDNVYDTYNVGGLFRLADALSMEKIYLCGETETPPNSRIKKASIGTYKIVPWEYKKTALEAIEEVKGHTGGDRTGSPGVAAPKQQTAPIKIVAVEQHPKAISYTDYNYIYPLALIVGNETTGISKEALAAADAIVEIPMFGINKSLNVIVSAAVVSYFVNQKLAEKKLAENESSK